MPGATLSDKSAREEFGLSQPSIMEAIHRRKLQYRVGSMFGNPYFRLLRSEVEALVRGKHGGNYLKKKKIEKALDEINRELRKLQKKALDLERKKTALLASLGAVNILA